MITIYNLQFTFATRIQIKREEISTISSSIYQRLRLSKSDNIEYPHTTRSHTPCTVCNLQIQHHSRANLLCFDIRAPS